MYYFIPSWYNQDRTWFDMTPRWSRVYNSVKFDDTINQYRMFEITDKVSSLIILNYQPQLRYYLHKQDLFGASYWSFFDDIQNIDGKDTSSIDFKYLNWPEGTSFIYTPFSVTARNLKREVIGVIDFAENGNLLTITNYSQQVLTEVLYFDDRGFLSSILYYENGEPSHQDYLNRNGVWQVRESLKEFEGLKINPSADKSFKKTHYASWEELMQERLSKLTEKQVTEEDVFVIASDKRHNALLLDAFPQQKKIFSFFSGRNELSAQEDLSIIINHSKVLLVDSIKLKEKLESQMARLNIANQSQKISQISPFDTRLRLGNSQTIKELIVYFFIDTISEAETEKYCKLFLESMALNPLIHLQIVTFQQGAFLNKLEEILTAEIHQKYDPTLFFKLVEGSDENQIDETTEVEFKNIQFSFFTNETQIIQAMDKARVVVDLGEIPDLYTHIASISAGLPQINIVETEYVEHKKNGWILSESVEIKEAFQYYFDGLANWNRSIVYAVQKMADYTSGRILEKWDELLYDEEEY